MKVTVSTLLNAQDSKVWALVKKSSTLSYICKGLLEFKGASEFPAEWQTGEMITTRLRLFSLIPAWKHQIHFVKIRNFTLVTNERGGLVKQWDHTIKIASTTENKCQYTDIVDVSAGMFTPVIFLFAHALYRYRQHRWKKLIQKCSDYPIYPAESDKGDTA